MNQLIEVRSTVQCYLAMEGQRVWAMPSLCMYAAKYLFLL
jgi:hypothetical protein